MISHEHRVVFVHIPKAAGTSVEAAFGHHGPEGMRWGVQDHRTLRQLQWPHVRVRDLRSTANVAEALRATKARVRPPAHAPNRLRLTREQYASYLKFTVVRNPWARTWSWYRNAVTDPDHRARLGLAEDTGFAAFVAERIGTDLLRPQTYWIQDFSGRIGVDVVCRFEQLERDVAAVADRVGLPGVELPRLNTGSDPTGRPGYLDAYDDTTRRLVAEVHREEIELFGYRFAPQVR